MGEWTKRVNRDDWVFFTRTSIRLRFRFVWMREWYLWLSEKKSVNAWKPGFTPSHIDETPHKLNAILIHFFTGIYRDLQV